MDSEPKKGLPRRPDLERSKRIKADILRLYKLPGENMHKVLEEVFDFAELLRKKYPKGVEKAAESYAIFHDLIGSSMGEDSEAQYPGIIYDDLPGEYSIENFVKGLVEKYK